MDEAMSTQDRPNSKHRALPGQATLSREQWAEFEAQGERDFWEPALQREVELRRQLVNLPENLKALRLRLNIKQSDMAERLGISLRSMQLYEKGARALPADLISEIFAQFGIDIHQLFTAHPHAPSPEWKEAFSELVLRVAEEIQKTFPNLSAEERRNLVTAYMRRAEINEEIDGGDILMLHSKLFAPEATEDDFPSTS
ncbi:helix-turn-helix domain-containing protein [Salipiger abyssi]|uniref:helix-turn-helix domain-containing protein n=1 Tax=Salipiger abyssi TaxID=1250539 RepID=UPI000978A50D|nr:helix-turn-helix transcriptional regulator [Salipiger abyssi]